MKQPFRAFTAVSISMLAVTACASTGTSEPQVLATVTSEAAATSTVTPTTEEAFDRSALDDSNRMCVGIVDFFIGVKELQEMTGEQYDPDKSAAEFMQFVQSPGDEVEAAWSPEDGPRWQDMSDRERANLEIAIQNAADGSC